MKSKNYFGQHSNLHKLLLIINCNTIMLKVYKLESRSKSSSKYGVICIIDKKERYFKINYWMEEEITGKFSPCSKKDVEEGEKLDFDNLPSGLKKELKKALPKDNFE